MADLRSFRAFAANAGGGVVIAGLSGSPLAFGLLTGGSVAICGASTGLAFIPVPPKRLIREEDVLFTVVGVCNDASGALPTRRFNGTGRRWMWPQGGNSCFRSQGRWRRQIKPFAGGARPISMVGLDA
jgi:hypothetical protein